MKTSHVILLVAGGVVAAIVIAKAMQPKPTTTSAGTKDVITGLTGLGTAAFKWATDDEEKE